MKKEEEKLAKLLTGEHITGLSENSEFQNVADELEGDEYVQFPDNTTQRVVGKKHTKGGEDMVLPNGTKVLTASIKVGARDAKKLSDQYGFKVNKDDTYAKILDKYKKHVGLEKLNEEQEEYIKEQMKLEESDIDPGSLRVNQEFISSKINDLEEKKSSLEQEKAQVFKTLYALQEQKKEGKAKYQKEGMMKYGGTLRSKRDIMKQKYENGGRADYVEARTELKKKLVNGDIKTEDFYKEMERVADKFGVSYSPENDMFAQRVSGSDDPFKVQDFAERIRLKDPGQEEYPYSESEAYTPKGIERLNTYREKYGLDKIDTDAGRQKGVEAVKELQDKIVEQNPNLVVDYMTNRSHQPNKKLLRKLEDKGYTGTTNETVKEALEKGDISEEDIKDAYKDDKWWYRAMETTQKDLPEEEYNHLMEQIKEKGIGIQQGEDIYVPDPNDPQRYIKYNPIPQEPTEETPPVEEEDPNIVTEDPVRQVNQRYPRAYYTPDQSVLPPGGLEAHTKIANRFGRIDAPRVGVEDQLQQAATQRMQASNQLRDLPPTQRAAAIANMTGQLQTAENQAITAANRTNAQNQARTEMFNVQQADKENVYAGNNALNYEQRQLTAKAKTDEELRNYLDYNRKVALTNFRNTQDRNLIASVFPDYDTDFYGMTPVYEPEDPNWTVEDRANRLRLMRATGNQPT